ncbi:MAG: hypothetical protein ABEJ61_06870 [Haloferacaceae archaeon]
MRRRSVLAALSLAFAGCAGAGTGGSGSSTPSTSSDSPTVTDRSLTPGESTCATGETGTASVAFEEDAVRVTGTLVTPTPCHGAELRSATYDRAANELRVVVGPSAPTTDACVQCLGAREYAATVRFEGGLPGRVVVVHAGSDGERTVATATL